MSNDTSKRVYMEGMDAVSGSIADCYVKIGTRSYNFMQMTKFESKFEKTITEVPILGKPGKGHKAGPWKGTWSGTAHYNQSIIRLMLYEYKNTGKDVPFEITVTNNDPSSAAGKQTITHKGCLISGGTLAKFDSGSELLDEELSGTFDDFEIPDKFNILQGM